MENLKALVRGVELTTRQKADAHLEFNQLSEQRNELLEALEKLLRNTCTLHAERRCDLQNLVDTEELIKKMKG